MNKIISVVLCIVFLFSALSVALVPAALAADSLGYNGEAYSCNVTETVTVDGKQYRKLIATEKNGDLPTCAVIYVNQNGDLITDKALVEKLVFVSIMKSRIAVEADTVEIRNRVNVVNPALKIVDYLGNDLVEKALADAVWANFEGLMAAFSGNVSGFGASYYEFIAASGVKMTTYAAYVGHLHEMIERSMESWNAYWSYYQRVRPAIDERGLTYEEAVQYEKLAKTCIADLMTAEYYLRYLASCVDGKIDVNTVNFLDVLVDLHDVVLAESFWAGLGVAFGDSFGEMIDLYSNFDDFFAGAGNSLKIEKRRGEFYDSYDLMEESSPLYISASDVLKNAEILRGIKENEDRLAALRDKSVFLKQQLSYTCTLASAAMMLRRTAILLDMSDWSRITEKSIKSKAWIENAGLRTSFSYSFSGVTFKVAQKKDVTGDYNARKQKLIALLEKYPQGIAIYNSKQPHCVLLTRYDAATDTFYCSDPWKKAGNGEIKLAKSILKGGTQKAMINGITSYWYVSTPSVAENHNTLTVKYHANGGTVVPKISGYTYKITASAGVNLRKGAGTEYGVITAYKKGTEFTVTETKTVGRYTWGKTTIGKNTGWMVINKDFATKIGTKLTSDYYLQSSLIYEKSTSKLHTQTMRYGEQYKDGLYNASTLGLEREGYTFLGWSLTATGEQIIDQNRSLSPEEIVPAVKNGSRTVVLYAIWRKN